MQLLSIRWFGRDLDRSLLSQHSWLGIRTGLSNLAEVVVEIQLRECYVVIFVM